MTGRVLVLALLAGWLADRLARPDRDVEAGIEAYQAGELDAALERFEAAIARHGDRPELSLNRGLVLLAQSLRMKAADAEAADDDGLADAARRAFERASESDDPEIRASAFYERGNVAFDAEQWDTAIESYIECLKARPDHANAKWNLELARKKKAEQEKEDEKDEEDEEDEQDDTGGEDSGSSTGDDTGGSTGDTGDTGDSTGGESGESTGGSSGGGESGESGGSGGSGGSGEQPPEPGTGEEGGSGGDEPKDDPQPPPPQQPAPLDQMDLQKALEELDEQDRFLLDRPSGGVRPPTEDW